MMGDVEDALRGTSLCLLLCIEIEIEIHGSVFCGSLRSSSQDCDGY